MTAKRLNLFPTPVVIDRLPDSDRINQQLSATILQRMAQDSGLKRSNVGGWHSTTDLTRWGGEAAAEVVAHALKLATANTRTVGGAELSWKVAAWANVNGIGAGNQAHVHGATFWAAVYYVSIGSGEGGRLLLHDPRVPALRMHAPRLRFTNAGAEVLKKIRPEAGDMVLFPAWLMHSVEAWQGEGERISIAMNIKWVPRKARADAGRDR